MVVVSPIMYLADLASPTRAFRYSRRRHGVVVESVIDDFAVSVACAAIHNVAAGHPSRLDVGIRMEDPLHGESRLA